MLQVLTLNVAKIILTVIVTVLAEKCCHILKTSAFQIHQLCKHTHVTNITYTACLLTIFGKLISHIAPSWPEMKIFSPEDPYFSCRMSCLTIFQFISNKVICMVVETYL